MDRDRRRQIETFLRDASDLRNIYWFIRYSRFHKDVRRYYRKAQKEKGRLAALGHDPEVIRLYRLHLRKPHCQVRYYRFEQQFYAPYQLPLF